MSKFDTFFSFNIGKAVYLCVENENEQKIYCFYHVKFTKQRFRMKNLLKKVAVIAGVGALSFVGCKSLTESPDFASPDTFYQNESDMLAAINGAYQPLNKEWFNVFYNRCVIDCALGIQGGYEKGPQYYESQQYVGSDEYITTFWAQLYDGVNRTNVVLDALGKVPAEKISAAMKTRISGEAHFLRAMYYFHLFSYFENIPVPSTPTRQLSTFEGNDGGKDKALELMIADLKAAATELPATFTGSDSGRPTKWAAKTLLAKVYLEKKDYENAKREAEEVVLQSGVTLYADFDDVFDTEHENQGERFFEVQCNFDKSPWENYNNMHAHFTPTDWDGGDPNSLAPGDGVTAAGWADAWIVGDNQFRTDYFPPSANDKREAVTFMSQYRSKNVGGDIVRYDPTASSPFVAPNSPDRKFKNVIYQKVIEYKIGGWQNTKKNYVFLRLSDALLTHSEAIANGASGDALFGVNKVRVRAGLPALSGVTGDALKKAIFDEWMREFAGEGWAFPICRRTGRTAEMIQKYAGRAVDNNKFRVLPIPLVEITGNSNIKQNAGW
jgi:starch-binding outer membrane protein, SusD/RagB family